MTELVEYIGRADVRIISEADWALRGITQADTQWDHTNKHMIPLSALGPEALTYCLEVDGEFVIVNDVVDHDAPSVV